MLFRSAVSLNIEVPGRKHAEKLSSYKNFDADIVRPLKYIAAQTAKGSRHAKIRTTTQFIVGASDETDSEIIAYLDGIYNRLKFRRAYFSAYQRGLGDDRIPGERFTLESETAQRQEASDRLTREHRLYQADFLLRKYHFNPQELIFDGTGNFDLTEDPKLTWAKRHPEQFPVNLATADRDALLRIPGLGPTYADRILDQRRSARITSLACVGLKGKNAEKANRYCVFA